MKEHRSNWTCIEQKWRRGQVEYFVKPVKVLDHGFVGLEKCMADDLDVVNSARVSFANRHEVIEQGDAELINYLLRDHHGTPFEHTAFRFDVKAPIFVFREWHRHRIASINEMSARYVELPAEWYVPEVSDVRVRIGKPGKYTYEAMETDLAKNYVEDLKTECERSYDYYRHWLDRGLAPEQARTFLHVNHYSQMWWTINARSLMNFLNLRNAPTAQWEIRQFAIEVEKIFSKYMPITHEAFVRNGRVAP